MYGNTLVKKKNNRKQTMKESQRTLFIIGLFLLITVLIFVGKYIIVIGTGTVVGLFVYDNFVDTGNHQYYAKIKKYVNSVWDLNVTTVKRLFDSLGK